MAKFFTFPTMRFIPFRHLRMILTFELTVPDIDIELIRLFVRGRLFTKMRGKQASLDRFKVGGGKRDDNPISDEVEDLMRDYRDAIATRYRGGAVNLYRLGRVK